MYWIYLIIFLAAVAVPQLIQGDVSWLDQEELETMSIFLLGSTGFFLYLWKEKQMRQHISDKLRLQKETTKISRDLMDSYSYIGEINRKLDILKNIALGLPETGAFTPEKQKEVYDSIIEAVSVLTKSEEFILRFVDCQSGKIEKEMRMGKPKFDHRDCHLLAKDDREVYSFEDCFVVRAPRLVGTHGAFIILDSKASALEDPGLLKALASQALFLFTLHERESLSPPVLAGGSRSVEK